MLSFKKENLPLALQTGILSYAMTLTGLNQVAGLPLDELLGREKAFSEFSKRQWNK